MMENVAVIETPIPDRVDEPIPQVYDTRNEVETETVAEAGQARISVQPAEELSTDERIVYAMTDVLCQMKHMDKSQIRRIAFSLTVMCQQGVDLNRNYSIPVIQDEDLSGYELAAWCYCTFMSAFPSMQDKLQLPYEEHYIKARHSLGLE